MLHQEPRLDPAKNVLGNVEEGVAETKALLTRFEEIAEQMATDYSDALLDEMGKLQEQLDHRNAWDLDSQLEQAMDALRCPPPDSPVTDLSGGERHGWSGASGSGAGRFSPFLGRKSLRTDRHAH